MMIVAIAAGSLGFVVLFWTLVLTVKLRQHRTDLRPSQFDTEGASRIGHNNLTNPENYDAEGKHLLRWLSVAQIAWLVSSVLVLFALLRFK
jgi:hypothetical protein